MLWSPSLPDIDAWKEILDCGGHLTRDQCKELVQAYRRLHYEREAIREGLGDKVLEVAETLRKAARL